MDKIAKFFLFLAIILVLVVVVLGKRTGAPVEEGDALAYDLMARSFLASGTLEVKMSDLQTFREPVYPLFLATIYAMTGSSALGVVFAQAVLMALFLLKLHSFLSARFSRQFAWLVCAALLITPGFAFAAGELITEAVFTVFLGFGCIWFVEALERKNISVFMISGFSLGLATATRSIAVLLPLMFSLCAWLYANRNRSATRFTISCAALFLLSSYAVTAAWAARNYIRYGVFQPLSSVGGIVMAQHAEKTMLPPREFAAYATSVVAGDFFAERIFPFYRTEKYAIEQNITVAAIDDELRARGMADYDRDRWFKRRAWENFTKRPIQYFAANVLEVVKLNTPMQYNQMPLRRLFSGADFSVWRLVIIIAVRFCMYSAIVAIAAGIWLAVQKRIMSLLFLAIPIAYANILLSFFEGAPRYAMPFYPFYAIFGVIWVLLLTKLDTPLVFRKNDTRDVA